MSAKRHRLFRLLTHCPSNHLHGAIDPACAAPQDGETLDADVIIGAFGINSTLGRRLTSLGTEVIASTPAEFSAFMKNETERFAEAIRISGTKLE